MKLPSKNIIQQAAIAAAFSAGFNSEWLQGQFAALRRDMDFGGVKPWVPYILAAGAAFYVMKGR